MKKITKIMVMGMLIIISLGLFTGCSQDPSQYTLEEHIQRISERIEERYIKDNDDYASFEVYPLYDINDELYCFLVEFEPFGFVYVKTFKTGPFTAHKSMYALDSLSADRVWQRYTIDETKSQPWPDTDKRWETDKNGIQIFYKKSPYSVAGVENEIMYLLDIKDESNSRVTIHAVKREDKYLNLISMENVDMVDGKLTKKQAVYDIAFYASSHFDL